MGKRHRSRGRQVRYSEYGPHRGRGQELLKSRTIRFAWIRGRSRPRPLATSANFHDGWQHACRTAEDTDQGPLIRATREHSLERVDYSLVAQRGVSVDGPPPVCSLDDPPLCCIVDGTVRCVKKTLSALRRTNREV